MTESPDTERVAVRTYVPAYQREEWDRHADDLDMSRAEFVRTMVQAGRRGFDLDGGSTTTGQNAQERGSPDRKPPEGGSPTVTPGVEALETGVLDLLESEGPVSWEELVAGLTDDIEERLDEVLAALQRDGRIRYSGRLGGYAVVDDGE